MKIDVVQEAVISLVQMYYPEVIVEIQIVCQGIPCRIDIIWPMTG